MIRNQWYSPDGRAVSLDESIELMRDPKVKIVARTSCGHCDVSTVFLSLDHNYAPSGPPLIFETMIFGGPLDQETRRYPTRSEAEAGHTAMVKIANAVHFVYDGPSGHVAISRGEIYAKLTEYGALAPGQAAEFGQALIDAAVAVTE